MNLPKALIFDLDGTIIDNMEFHYESWRKFFSLNGFEFDSAKVRHLASAGLSREIIKNFFGNDVTDEKALEMVGQKENIYRNLYRQYIKPISGLVDFLQKAKQREIPVAIATGSDYGNIDFALNTLNLRNYFRIIVGAEDVTKGKPAPDIFLLAAEKLGIAAEDCLVFEDSKSGIEAARAAGMKTIALTTLHSKGELKSLPGVLHMIDNYADPVLNSLFDCDFSHSVPERRKSA